MVHIGIEINPLMPGGNKKVLHILKQTCSYKLQICLSMCDFSYHQAYWLRTFLNVIF